MKAQILTPSGQIFDGEVNGVQMPGVNGSFEVRQNHAKLVSLLDIGKLTVKTPNEGNIVYAISGGFSEVRDNVVTVMAEEAIVRDEIDLQGDLLKQKEIMGSLQSLKTNTDEYNRMESELRKISNRVAIAQN